MPSTFLDPHYCALYSQKLIERTYLNGFKSAKKLDKHNGYVERIIHGAEHAGRVSLYIPALHQLFQQHFPTYVQQSMDELKKKFPYDETQLILLLRYVALAHDTARQDERGDYWERGSANVARMFLIEHGVLDEHASQLSKIIWCKDPLQVSEEHLAYFKILLALSDCFDIIRCVGIFDYQFVAKFLKHIPHYNSAQHDRVFFDFAESVYCLLKQTHDLYFKVSLRDPSGHVHHQNEKGTYFSLDLKAKIEQAPNVLVVLERMMRQLPEFAPYLPAMPTQILTVAPRFLHPIRLTSAPMFPYELLRNQLERSSFYLFIHGTNSRTLPILAKSNFEMQGPLALMNRFLLAPLSGEINKGGLSIPGGDCKPCFALVHDPDNGDDRKYELPNIINNYASSRIEGISIEQMINQLRHSHDEAVKELFYNINELMLYFTRTCQLGIPYPAANEMLIELKQTINLYYFYLLIAKYSAVNPLVQATIWAYQALYMFSSSSSYSEITNVPKLNKIFKNYFNTQNLWALFQAKNIDFVNLYHHYSQQAYQMALDQLEFNLNGLPIFIPKKQANATPGPKWYPQRDRHDIILKAICSSYPYSPHDMIVNFIVEPKQSLLSGYFNIELETLFKSHVNVLENALSYLQKRHADKTAIIEMQDDLIQNPFPMILIKTENKILHAVSMDGEFRAHDAARLGENISSIATNSTENQQRLIAFLKLHHLDQKINVILFSDLQTLYEKQKQQESISLPLRACFFAPARASSTDLELPEDKATLNIKAA